MSEPHVHYITGPLKGLIFTLSAHSGLATFLVIKSARVKKLVCKRQNNK